MCDRVRGVTPSADDGGRGGGEYGGRDAREVVAAAAAAESCRDVGARVRGGVESVVERFASGGRGSGHARSRGLERVAVIAVESE